MLARVFVYVLLCDIQVTPPELLHIPAQSLLTTNRVITITRLARVMEKLEVTPKQFLCVFASFKRWYQHQLTTSVAPGLGFKVTECK